MPALFCVMAALNFVKLGGGTWRSSFLATTTSCENMNTASKYDIFPKI